MINKIRSMQEIAEKELVAPIRGLFPANRFMMKTEVPFNGKTIDVLLLDRKTQQIIAVELKIRKWQKALRQAAVYQLCAAKVYVALWHKYIKKRNRNLMTEYGLGLIAVRPLEKGFKAEIVLPPKRTGLLNRVYAEQLRGHFRTDIKRQKEI